MSPLLIAAAAFPVCAATLGLIVFTTLELAGLMPSRDAAPRNLAEAAAMGTLTDVARRLHEGEDPRAIVSVRPQVISSSVRRVTTLEAAVWRRSGAVMRTLDRAGAIADEKSRRELACLAMDLRAEEIVEQLLPAQPKDCVAGAALDRVQARSREP